MRPELAYKLKHAKAKIITEEIMETLYSPEQLDWNKMCKWRYDDVTKLVATILMALKIPALDD